MNDPVWISAEEAALNFAADTVSTYAAPAQAVLPERAAQALKGQQEQLARALRQAGQSGDLAAQLQSFVSTSVETQMRLIEERWQQVLAQANIHIDLRPSAAFIVPSLSTQQPWPEATAQPQDPLAGLSAVQLGQALGGLSDETVRLREKAGELFSLLRPGRKRGREYPAFQASPSVVGEPLRQVLARLGGGTPVSGATAYGFFSATNPELGQLSAVEALTGSLTQTRPLAPEATALLAAPQAARLGAVLEAAGAYAADQAP